ncbi:MAG: hypothetical protein DI537_40650 [Stutzerimonas stutzeri]|nr:MAG: hypothetical protein DI537_40650 [Stutzerimonas stutzeri]
MSHRVEVRIRSDSGNERQFTRYYPRDVLANLTIGVEMRLADTPLADGIYKIVRKVISWEPSAEEIEFVILTVDWQGHY